MTKVNVSTQEVWKFKLAEEEKLIAGYLGIDDPRAPSGLDLTNLIGLVRQKKILGYNNILGAAKCMDLELDVSKILEPFKHLNTMELYLTDREILLILAIQIRRALND